MPVLLPSGAAVPPLLLLSGAGIVAGLGAALVIQARTLARLREELKAEIAALTPAPEPPPRGRRPSAPTFGALYQSPPAASPLEGVAGAPALVVAGVCTLAALLLGLRSQGAAPEPVAQVTTEVAGLRGQFDSLAGRVRLLEDSLATFRAAVPGPQLASRADPRRSTRPAPAGPAIAPAPPPPAFAP